MEQIAAFVLGVSAVAFVWVVVVVFKTSKLAKQNKESIRNAEEWILRNDESLNRRIDQEINRTNNIHTDSIRYIDSRVDKLEAKLSGTLGAKQVIKG